MASARFVRVSARRMMSSTCFVSGYSTSSEAEADLVVEHLNGRNKGVVVFGLNRPQAKNAFSRNMVATLSEAIETVSVDESCHAVILRSTTPGIFCAGADLKRPSASSTTTTAHPRPTLRSVIVALENMPMPVIAAIDGPALGGGLELALACDLRVSSENAKLGLVETRLAIMPGLGGTQRLSRLVGMATAKELIFTARVINGIEAQKIGLVNYAVKQNPVGNAAFQRAIELARTILTNCPVSVKMAKYATSRGCEVNLETGLALEDVCSVTKLLRD